MDSISARMPWQRQSRAHYSRYLVFFALLCILYITFGRSSSPSFSRSSRKRIQHDFRRRSTSLDQPDRLAAVRTEFVHAWTGYKDHAWMADSLKSLTGGRNDQFCGWSATLIDSLDTLWIMNLRTEFNLAVEAAVTIDFAASTSTCEVNIFESTIRYLGGMLAAYDLSQDARLLPKLKELGDILHLAFDSANGFPCNHCDLSDGHHQPVPSADAPLADMGSFYLEFGRLWQITGDERYLKTLNFLTETFERTQNQSTVPGLWPERVDATSVDGDDPHFATSFHVYSLGALSDSAYEYLVKAHLMLGSLTNQYSKMWELAAVKIRELMLFRAHVPPSSRVISEDLLFSGVIARKPEHDDVYLEPRTQHLACFAGGMFAMASRLFDDPHDLMIGAALTDGCVWAYNATVTGIMPETFSLLECPSFDSESQQCQWNQTEWKDAQPGFGGCTFGQICDGLPDGFLASIDTHYALRPEAIESVFMLYRITGDETWRDKGWVMFQRIIEQTRTPFGHATIDNTMAVREQYRWEGNKEVAKNYATQRDEMESFWLAETLKYFWLLFSDPDLISLDEWVLNTEAHPLRLIEGQRAIL